MNTRPLRFFFRGQIQEVRDLPPTTSVLRWLRESADACGTKEGCAEGDCGACTVLVGELDDHERLQLRHLNACIQFLPMLDGKALFTVEDLGDARALNPVQQALVDCHGSQCGFCTPGFAMTLQAMYETHQAEGTRPTRQQLADGLAGNLCRCTGYRPILEAGERMFDAPVQRLDRAPAERALQQLKADPPLAYAAWDPGLAAVREFHAPRSLEALAALRQQQPEARLVAGATDIGLWVNKQHRDVGTLISTTAVGALRQLQEVPLADGQPGLWIGAGVPLEEAWAALVAQVPALRELWLRFASPPVRHAGTLGGNIANGSPIGDGAPALIALGAEIVLRRGEAQRRLPLQDFYLDYMKNALQPGEFVEALHVPLPAADWQVRGYKIAKRYDSDISAVCAVFALRLDAGRVAQVRLAFGGLAGIVKRAAKAEAALVGQAWDEAAAQRAGEALSQDFQPLSDLRASATYRLQVAKNLLRRCWLETRAEQPLPASQSGVWWATQLGRDGHTPGTAARGGEA
ncbi:xanthine dehydrogenase small subunit [Pelomonas sp. APW6]|uniref:Xanthine dehydrogenase small subunit n=1 Tax=Roseateles subflavus TaxID=3053353 RepID=A0ABT7LGH6_9BURK|nr:xanthine dehydrogenase small subunit [Pelomonas sp. APW6]MDL5031949.1 xanthine dehydrogenase small subunit [Pelomonas sp. APW6]